MWWVSDVSKFKNHYPKWDFKYDLKAICGEIYEGMKERVLINN